jgi:hypothetical protein
MSMVVDRPFAVAGFIVPVVVDAIDGVFSARPLTHVSEEIIKDQPAFADCDAATPIPFELDLFGVETPLLHLGPRQVGLCDSGFGGVAMANLCFPFALKASAAGGVSARQIVADDDDLDAAVAATQKAFVFGLGVREADDGQAAKTLFRDGGSHV